jgi:hypothetical protein
MADKAGRVQQFAAAVEQNRSQFSITDEQLNAMKNGDKAVYTQVFTNYHYNNKNTKQTMDNHLQNTQVAYKDLLKESEELNKKLEKAGDKGAQQAVEAIVEKTPGTLKSPMSLDGDMSAGPAINEDALINPQAALNAKLQQAEEHGRYAEKAKKIAEAHDTSEKMKAYKPLFDAATLKAQEAADAYLKKQTDPNDKYAKKVADDIRQQTFNRELADSYDQTQQKAQQEGQKMAEQVAVNTELRAKETTKIEEAKVEAIKTELEQKKQEVKEIIEEQKVVTVQGGGVGVASAAATNPTSKIGMGGKPNVANDNTAGNVPAKDVNGKAAEAAKAEAKPGEPAKDAPKTVEAKAAEAAQGAKAAGTSGGEKTDIKKVEEGGKAAANNGQEKEKAAAGQGK